MRRLSLRQKVLTMIGLVTTAALVVAFSFVIAHDVADYEKEMKENLVLVAEVVGGYAVPDLAFEDRETAAESLAKLESVPSVTSASLFDDDGELFASYGDVTTHRLPAGGLERWVELSGDALHVVQPIDYKGDRYGAIYLEASTARLDDKIRAHLVTLGLVLAALVALAWIVALRLQRIVSEPILELASTTRRITLTGDYSLRVEKRADDEIGVLCDGFNDMLEQIHEREVERDEAEHRTQEKSRFMANMSHELRTPLNSIIGFSEILIGRTEGRLEAREAKFLANILASGRHLLSIINDILDLSKVEAGRMELHPEPLSVRPVVEGVATVMKALADANQVTIAFDVPDDAPSILADPVKLKQVLYNLLSNAVKFSPEGAAVLVRARVHEAPGSPLGERAMELAVTDEGPGIPPDELERVFEAFHQVDGTESRRFGGTGLGLSLVQSFVELHDGRVTVESAVDKGTTFRVFLPLRSAGEPSGDSTGSRRAKVLVVEDEAATSEMLSEALEDQGFDPVLATNGESAVALARALRPAAVTLDLVLPGLMDGWDVLKALKADAETRDIPIVIYSRMESQELGMALGADDYFLKPVDLERLTSRLRELLSTDGGRPRLLLIDDDESVHDLLAELLEQEGYAVDHAYGVDEGLTKARLNPPTLVVVDLMMGRMDGFEVAMRLAEEAATASVPLVLLTNHDLSAVQRDELKGKGVERAGKTDSGELLIKTLRNLLERRRPGERAE